MDPLATAGDPRFFHRTGPHTLQDVVAAAGGEMRGGDVSGAAAGPLLYGLAPLQLAGPEQVSFLDNRRYARDLATTRAGVVILLPELADQVPPGSVAIVNKQPRLAWARVAALFHPVRPLRPGTHPSAVVDPAAKIDAAAEIGPLAVVGAGAEIAAGCRIGAAAVIGEGVVLGPDCRIGAHASLSHCILGARVYVYPGARIGQEGFGFETGPDGIVSVPQLGRVLLEDDVEVGANTTIDRGSVGDTVIGAGSRLDNQVQIAHNVRLGRCCVIVAQVGISGSTVIEDFVVIAGQAGVAGHLHIGKGAQIGGQSGVMANLPDGAVVVGSPATPVREFFRQVATLRKLAAGTRADSGRPAKPGTGDAPGDGSGNGVGNG